MKSYSGFFFTPTLNEVTLTIYQNPSPKNYINPKIILSS